jgi:hypothetical protein
MRIDAQIKLLTLLQLKLLLLKLLNLRKRPLALQIANPVPTVRFNTPPLPAQVRLKGRIVNLTDVERTGAERTEAERHAEDN